MYGRLALYVIGVEFIAYITHVNGFIKSSGQEPVCPDITCYNDGILSMEICTCFCPKYYSGLFCEKELKASSWPQGKYSLLSTVFGCPEDDNHGWYRGYINMTLPTTRPAQRWKLPRIDDTPQTTDDPHILGPYYFHSLQLNFCTRLDDTDDEGKMTTSGMAWPNGYYCIFQVGDTCPPGFNESSVTFGGYIVTPSDTDGVLPTMFINETTSEVMLTYCCREDSAEDTNEMVLPAEFPFILLKVNSSNCNNVSKMIMTEERFDLVDDLDLFVFQGQHTMFNRVDMYQRLGICYFDDTSTRECYYPSDLGFSYTGTANKSRFGETCRNWETVDLQFIPNKKFVGEFKDNHCRKYDPHSSHHGPVCFVKRNGNTVFEQCDIPACTLDPALDVIETFKPAYGVAPYNDMVAEHAVDGNIGGDPFHTERPKQKPWIQVDLEEMFEVHAVHVTRQLIYFPVNFRFVAIHISNIQWDFFNYGALQCEKRRNPRKATKFRFVCIRPVIGQYVTIRNFDDPHHDNGWGTYYFLEITEIQVIVKRTVCGRRLGMVSGGIRDFQISGSSDHMTNLFDQGRLLLPGPGWCSEESPHAFFMIDLIAPMVVLGVEVQGWIEGQDRKIIDEFSVEYGVIRDNLTAFLDYRGVSQKFKIDSSSPATMIRRYMFHEEIVARYIRLNVTNNDRLPCMKVEVIGCAKQIHRDLECKNSSMDYGYDVVIRGGFWLNNAHSITTSDVEECISRCVHGLEGCVGFTLAGIRCDFYRTTRYNPHYIHSWVTTLSIYSKSYTQLCISKITGYTDCSRSITVPTILNSPSYPFFYGQLLNCTWSIVFPSDKYIRIHVIDVQMAAQDTGLQLRETGVLNVDPGKCIDTLRLGGLVITAENAATFKEALFISDSSSMFIHLKSCARYSRIDYAGFRFQLSYSDIPGCFSDSTVCSAKCTAQQALIMNPGYPSIHIPSTSCRWRIQGNVGSYVHLTFKAIVIPSDDRTCQNAYVSVEDVSLLDVNTEIGRFCSVNVPINAIKSSWQSLELKFLSGEDISSSGFMAQYRLINHLQGLINDSTEGCGTWQRYGDDCYQIFRFDEGLTWLAADSKCQDYGGQLISLQTKNKVTFLHFMLTERWAHTAYGESDFYIGLQKVGNNGLFSDLQWSDGSSVTYTAWYKDSSFSGDSQPDGLDNERCTLLRLYSIHSTDNWHDVACAFDKTKLFICERKNDPFEEEPRIIMSVNRTSSNASKDLFRCQSGEYIQELYTCDGHRDCLDHTDELHCGSVCTYGTFQCEDGSCIKAGLHCDFRQDCNDNSDEKYCIYPACEAGEWRCHSGQCIPDVHRCDVKHDCLDSSDELECRSCQSMSTFQCYDQRCLSKSRVCDGFYDCSGSFHEDEDNVCTQTTRPTCTDWYAIGKRENGSYIINMDYYGGFEAECRFYKDADGKQIIETIVHHEQEGMSTWQSGVIDIKMKYAARGKQIEILKKRSTCKQYFSSECSYSSVEVWWIGYNKVKAGNIDNNDKCKCPYIESCETGCSCVSTDMASWYGADFNEFRKDGGFLTEQGVLPLRSVASEKLTGPYKATGRITVGPLICQEELFDVGLSDEMVCENNYLSHVSARCTIDFDEYGELIGCRDLSHLQMDCENHECQPGQGRCLVGGYCLPRRFLCDGVKHCPSGEDEVGCDFGIGQVDNFCEGSYRCRRSFVCIDLSQLCDGQVHCPLADDEMLCDIECPSDCTCDLFAFSCDNGGFLTYLNDSRHTSRTNIRVLNISDKLLTVSLTMFSAFPLLNHLNLSECDIEHLHRSQFQFTVNLIVLDLSNNKIHILLENTFYGLVRLRVLLLKGNPLQIIEVNAFRTLESLPELDISSSNLNIIDEKMFSGLENLSLLNLSSSHIRKVKNNVFDTFQNLEVLDIRDNAITDFSNGIFNGMANLHLLYTTSFILCCVRPVSVAYENCFSPKDEFSSCDDLMKNETLRAFLWIIGLSALLGNMIVLVFRFVVDREGLGKTYGIFVSNLGFADFLMGIYLIILAVADTVFRGAYVWNDYQWRNGAMCKFAGVISTVASEGSVLFLCFITLDRILVVKFPFGNVRISRRVTIAMCILSWLTLFVIALVPLQLDSYFEESFYSRSVVCLPLPLTRDRPPGWEYAFAVFIVFNFLAFIMVATGQIIIYKEISSSGQKIASTGRRRDMAVARKLFFVAITDFLCWFPVGVMGMLALDGRVISGEVYAWIAVFVLPINSALNPFLYTLGTTALARTVSTARKELSIKLKGRTLKETTSITEVFDSDVFQFGKFSMKRRQIMPLDDLTMKRNVDIMEAFSVALRVANGVYLLHTSDMVHGSVTPHNVLVRDDNAKLIGVVLKSSPRRGTEEKEFTKDIFDYGATIRFLLKHLDVSN